MKLTTAYKTSGLGFFMMAILMSCQPEVEYYTPADFESVAKIDEHFHYLTYDEEYIDFADSLNFKLLSPTWDGEYSIYDQLDIAEFIYSNHKKDFAFMGAFSVKEFMSDDFADQTIRQIKVCLKNGASGVKIWKNIGMVLQDSSHRYVMIDDPKFGPVFAFLEKNHIPVIAHLGEPKDCWLPFDQMTDPSNKYYYKANPQYYMYLHPEVPAYEKQIEARDHILAKYPDLVFVGAHLGSLEWSLEELAERFDSYPNFKVDLAARMFYLRNQSRSDRNKVREFMIRYQDRIIYGTDIEVHDKQNGESQSLKEYMKNVWLSQWLFLATDSVTTEKGLQLPKEVVDKIYFQNAAFFFEKEREL